MDHPHAVIAIYPSHQEAEAAVKELHRSGYEMKKLSIIARDYQTEEHVIGYFNVGDRMKAWGRTGAFWGGLWGMLFGSAFFWIPGLGPALAAGPVVSWIVGTLEGAVAVGGLSVFGAALYTLGIPKDSILRYESAFKTGRYILITHGTLFDTNVAREILHRTQPESLDHHEHPNTELRTEAPAPLTLS